MSDTARGAVLVVEDEALILELVRTALEDAGFPVLTAQDDEEAVSALEAVAARGLAAMVTDVRLGGGRTGWDIARRARELNPELPVLYVTGDSAHEWIVQGVPRSTVMSKPFAAAQVVVALATLLEGTEGH
jgi:two-component system OmpR family response regulator